MNDPAETPEIPDDLRLVSYDFELPDAAIAQTPSALRDDSRLLVLFRQEGQQEHARFRDLPRFLPPNSLLVLNDTRVIPARVFGKRNSGGKVECLFLSPAKDPDTAPPPSRVPHWEILCQAHGRLLPGEPLLFDTGERLTLVAKNSNRSWLVRWEGPGELLPFLDKHGEMPLPPYIKRPAADPRLSTLDRERYQTVYAREAGAAAAPTAGLHFTPELLETLHSAGHETAFVTLHVGGGTFQPIQAQDIRQHAMPGESYRVTGETAAALNRTRAAGRPILAVGTTSLRVLESVLSASGTFSAGEGTTDIFLHPPLPVRSVNGLITNFHLPKSTLLLLVSAFAGREPILASYREAVREGYRFFSYGDAMLIL